MEKKLVPILLMVVIVFNFILCNFAYADTLDDITSVTSAVTRYGGNGTIKGEAVQSLIENGTDSQGNSMNEKNFGISLGGLIFQDLASVIDAFPITIQTIMSVITLNPNSSQTAFTTLTDGSGIHDFINRFFSLSGSNPNHYTIERTVFNEISIFNIDVFNQSESYTNSAGENKEVIFQHYLNLKFKESVTGWFYSIRLIAMMINLCVLIYVGIRMAITTIASEEAKYKKMLFWWVESMIMLFCLHYIIYAILYIGNVILNIINILRVSAIESGNVATFEDIIINRIYLAMMIDSGSRFFLYSLFFWFLTGIQVKFLLTYLKRTFTVLFLVVISPLITVTFPIDKLGNGKAEAFEMWLKELVINVLIQPIHAIVYLVFVYTAGKIAATAPWVAMIFLLSLGRVENIVRNVFKITDSVDNVNMARNGGGKGPGIGATLRMLMPGRGK